MDTAALYRRRRIVNFVCLGISLLTVLFGLFWLVWILWTLFAQGLGSLNLTTLLQTTPPPGSAGGLANAIFGSLLMSLLAIPVVLKTTENMLRLVPDSMREAAAALGAPQWIVISFVTLRGARAGIITGILLAVARISGETAPLLFTALNNQFWTTNMNAPMANLPVVIFQFAMSPYQDWQALAWGGALLITLSVLALNILARLLFPQKSTLA